MSLQKMIGRNMSNGSMNEMKMEKMMCDITEQLMKPLDPKYVKGRNQGGTSVSYVEGWHVIAEANRIFGFLNWDRETVYCREVSREKNGNGNHVIGYEAKVRITVVLDDDRIVREGTGSGSQAAKGLFDAIEGAAKEAETDAMKRALMTFGNPFGLALYDKTQANVQAPEPTQEEVDAEIFAKVRAWADKYVTELNACTTQSQFFDLKGDKKKQEYLNALEEKYPEIREEIHNVGARIASELGVGANKASNGAAVHV